MGSYERDVDILERELGIVEDTRADQLLSDRDQHEPHPGVRALVDVEVMIGRQRIHAQRQVEGPL